MIDPILIQIADALNVIARKRRRGHATPCNDCRWMFDSNITGRPRCTAYGPGECGYGQALSAQVVAIGCPKFERDE